MQATQVGWIACADDAPMPNQDYGVPVFTLSGQPGWFIRSWKDGVPEYVQVNGWRLVAVKAGDGEPMPDVADA